MKEVGVLCCSPKCSALSWFFHMCWGKRFISASSTLMCRFNLSTTRTWWLLKVEKESSLVISGRDNEKIPFPPKEFPNHIFSREAVKIHVSALRLFLMFCLTYSLLFECTMSYITYITTKVCFLGQREIAQSTFVNKLLSGLSISMRKYYFLLSCTERVLSKVINKDMRHRSSWYLGTTHSPRLS